MKVQFTGKPSAGLGLSFLPRCVVKVESFGADEKFRSPKQDLPGMLVRHRIVESWLADENGLLPKKADNSLVGMTFEHVLWYPGTDPEDAERRERDLKTAIIAHGAPREQVDTAAGVIDILEAHFNGRSAYLIYDPPAPDAEGNARYPKIKYIRPPEVNDVLTGTTRVPWPMDRKQNRSSATVQVGAAGAVGGFLQGANPVGGAQPGGAAPAVFGGTPANGGGSPIAGFVGGNPAAGGGTPPAGGGGATPTTQGW